VDANGVVCQLRLVALAHQEAPGPVALALIGRWGNPLGEQVHGRRELGLAAARRSDLGDDLGRYAPPQQLPLYPLGPPSLEVAPILGKSPGEALVVDEAGPLQLRDGVLYRLRLDALALQPRPQLGERAVAGGQRPVAQLEGATVLLARAQAAFSSGPSGSAGGCAVSGTAATAGPCSSPTAS
jgi:hypothetical protein